MKYVGDSSITDLLDLGLKKKGLCFRLHNQKNWSRSVGKNFFFAFFFYFEKFVSKTAGKFRVGRCFCNFFSDTNMS